MKLKIASLLIISFCIYAEGRAENWQAPEWLGKIEPLKFDLKVRLERPRLYITPEELPLVKERVKTTHRQAWEMLQKSLQSSDLRERMLSNSFYYLVTGEQDMARAAIRAALELSSAPPGDDWTATHKVWPEAVVYDWCYDRFEPEERKTLLKNIRAQLDSAGGGNLETQPPHAGHLVNHLADAHIPAGIAFYEEDPGILNRAVEVAKTQLAAKNVYYRWDVSSQGTSYGVTHYQADLRILTELYKATGTDLFPQFPFLKNVGYYWIYARRPDGQFLRNGDDWLDHRPQHSRKMPEEMGKKEATPYFDMGKMWTSPAIAEMLLYAAVRYNDPYLFNEYLLVRDLSRPWTAITDIIWRDPGRQARGPQDLPAVKYLGGPAGILLFRTGWGLDDVVGMFKTMPLYVKNHDHLDRLSFQIYCRGALTIDSGVYEGTLSEYDSDHWLQYYQRTIAHNCLLIRDPEEEVIYRGRKVIADGGQRYPRDGANPANLASLAEPDWHVAKVLARDVDFQGNYAYVTADATAGYGPKAELVKRTFIFLRGLKQGGEARNQSAAFLIRDCVRSANPGHRKVFLMHFLEEPEIHNDKLIVHRNGQNYGGTLVCRTLSPLMARIEKVGGPGHEFEVNGRNFPAGEKEGDVEGGAWRIEVSAAGEQKETEFLHALAVYPRTAEPSFQVKAEKKDGWISVDLPDWTVVMPENEMQARASFEYESQGQGIRKHLMIGLGKDRGVKVTARGKVLAQGRTNIEGTFSFALEQAGKLSIRVEVN